MEVKIARCCHCVKKNDLPGSTMTGGREDALNKAEEILKILEEKSCHAHRFFLREEKTAVVIDSAFDDTVIKL